MRNFTVQCFAVMMMMVMAEAGRLRTVDQRRVVRDIAIALQNKTMVTEMVEANPVKPAYLLRFIHEEAMALQNKTLPVVNVTYQRHNGICWGKFFCLAWQTLDAAPANLNEMAKLKRQIHSYNNAYGLVNCALDKQHKSHLMRFLKDIIECSSFGPIPHPPKAHISGSH